MKRIDLASRLAVPNPREAYIPPACAALLTARQRELVDELIRELAQTAY